MESTSGDRQRISIGETIMQLEEKRVPIVSLLQLYALTGCDTVSSLFRVGKIKAVGVIKKHPIHLTSSIVDFHDNYGPCLEFIARCYGMRRK